jgi:integrase
MRTLHKLTTRKAESLKKKGRYSDGGNLYLVVTAAGTRQWVFRYRWNDGEKEMGLGSAAPGRVSLATARKLAQSARDAMAERKDPLVVRNESQQSMRSIRTFGKVADEYLKAKKAGWRNPKHRAQWEYSLKTLAAPLRSMQVHLIENTDVLSVLRPLWERVPETARRLRGRIEAVLGFATHSKYREGENPARWKDNLKDLLSKHDELTRGHHAALPYEQMPEFIAKLRGRESLAASALELAILTACRTGEVLGAQWPEFDFAKKLWIIPATRMKMKREHRVPLSDRAVEILEKLKADEWGPYVFPGNTFKRPLSNMSMLMLLRRMNYDTITTHGFRSTFRDWASETTSFPHEVCEQVLAHKIKDKSEAAYRRGDLLAKRAKLMEAWASFCEPRTSAKVVAMKRKA